MAQCPICGALVPTAENQVCDNCRRSAYTAYVDPQGRQVVTGESGESPQTVERRRPVGIPVTQVLIAANVAVFLLMLVNGVPLMGPSATEEGFRQLIRWGADYGPQVLTGQYWRLFTAVFVHIGIIHIFMNMWCLWQLGGLAERLFGRGAYLGVYLLSGIAGNILSIARHPDVLGAGASGAVFGIAGALITMLKFGRLNVPREAVKPVLSSVVSFAIYNLLFGALVPFIDNNAHVGGFLCGLAIGYLLSLNTTSPDKYRRAKALVFPLVAALLFAAFVAVRYWRLSWLAQHLSQ